MWLEIIQGNEAVYEWKTSLGKRTRHAFQNQVRHRPSRKKKVIISPVELIQG
jgi:hypothetical protein